MPAKKIQVQGTELELNARPDRLDLRDRMYAPPLTPLAKEFPSAAEVKEFIPYFKGMILDQRPNGACTGYGLAAVINYQFWFRDVVEPALSARAQDKPEAEIVKGAQAEVTPKKLQARLVSPKMLFQLARLYDEWDGEDYEGSSCRGAMRGWHHHGVCLNHTWPYTKPGTDFEDKDARRNNWLVEAAQRPLGAYYRIATKSLADMQAAIQQVHAVYVGAKVHTGWRDLAQGVGKGAQEIEGELPIPHIHWDRETPCLGGHAFAIVGYNQHGFIVQNSWGEDWGLDGFALLTYADWLANSTDAWASVYGVETDRARSPKTKCRGPMHSSARGKSGVRRRKDSVEAWSEYGTAMHSIVLGNNGQAMSRLVHAADGKEHLQICAHKRVARWLQEEPMCRDLVIFAHGGLCSEADALQRSAVLGPYFMANGIFPLFVSWSSGLLTDLEQSFRDAIAQQKQKASGGHLTPSEMETQIRGTTAYTWEAIASNVSIRSIWGERKENAALAGETGGGMHLLAENLRDLGLEFPDLRIHLAGHSAGAMVIGSLLKAMPEFLISAKTATLWTPACTMEYAEQVFLAAMKNGQLPKRQLFVESLADAVEKEDSVVGLYDKSFLYLVSRALERHHKTPLLGMKMYQTPGTDLFAMTDFRTESALQTLSVHERTAPKDARIERYVSSSHCTYDQSIAAMERLLERILDRKPTKQVVNLKGPQAVVR